MIQHILRFTAPAAYSLLPPEMYSTRATALLLAIGLQESRFEHRMQIVRPGVPPPAKGFWQFEARGAVVGVLSHEQTVEHAKHVLAELQYPVETTIQQVHEALAHNDVLAFAFARLNLWWIPEDLPDVNEPARAWQQYLKAWNPGRPHRSTWARLYSDAWNLAAPDPSVQIEGRRV